VPTRRSFLTQLGILGLIGGGAWLVRDLVIFPAPRPRFPPGEAQWLPFARTDLSLITAVAGLGGKVVNAVVDSGAQFTSVDRAFVEREGLSKGLSFPMMALGVGGGGQMAHSVSVDLELGGVQMPGLRAAALDLAGVSEALGQDVALIIGFDVLSAVLADLDFPRRRFRLADPRHAPRPPGGYDAPVHRSGRALIAEATLQDMPVQLLVDTGSTGFVGISMETAQAAGIADREGRQGKSVVLGGVTDSKVVVADRFEFAGVVSHDIDVPIIEMPSTPGFPKGLMGVEALRHHHVLMDAGAGKMRLYPA